MKKSLALFVAGCCVLSMGVLAHAGTLFRLPLSGSWDYYGWFDHIDDHVQLNAQRRWDCATNFSYNDHHGTDYKVPKWTQIYAGARGGLYERVDNCPEGTDQACGKWFGNHVKIEHPDLLVTIYAHMVAGSPAWYQSLMCGAPVGKVGLSGLTTNYHLHFELWQKRSIGKRMDFYKGSCNAVGYWVNQNGGFPTTQCQ